MHHDSIRISKKKLSTLAITSACNLISKDRPMLEIESGIVHPHDKGNSTTDGRPEPDGWQNALSRTHVLSESANAIHSSNQICSIKKPVVESSRSPPPPKSTIVLSMCVFQINEFQSSSFIRHLKLAVHRTSFEARREMTASFPTSRDGSEHLTCCCPRWTFRLDHFPQGPAYP